MNKEKTSPGTENSKTKIKNTHNMTTHDTIPYAITSTEKGQNKKEHTKRVTPIYNNKKAHQQAFNPVLRKPCLCHPHSFQNISHIKCAVTAI